LKNRIFYILPLLLLFFVSCNTETKSTSLKENVVYFGGNIINPESTVVKLYKSDNNNDTLIVKLDKNNFFVFKIDSIETGIYTFVHGGEFQHVYLEKDDSLMIRLNTLEFDESLVFTGKGATINNYLIKRYLHNENNNINLFQLFSLNFNDFNRSIDSLKNIELELLQEFNFKGSDFSESSLKWVNNMLRFTEYNFKELYPYNNAIINNSDSLALVDNTFYTYRNVININDSTYFSNKYFLSFINSRIESMSLDSLFRVVSEVDFFNDSKSFEAQLNKIETFYINSNFKNQKVKNYLFFRNAKGLFSKELDIKELQSQLNPFFDNVDNDVMIKEIKALLSQYIKLVPGSKAPDFKIYNGKDSKLFSNYFNKPIYLFFWLSQDRYTWSTDLTLKYNELKKQFPNVQFISVYLDFPETWEYSKKISGANGVQFRADYEIIKDKYLIPSSDSFVLINKNGIIVESNANWPGSKKIKAKLRKLK